jgi:hypothetical protein
MGIFSLKRGDTYPILEVILLNPDGTVHDLTGTVSYELHIALASGSVLTRPMTKEGADTEGRLRYAWAPTDWDPGGLFASPYMHRMEYEVIGIAQNRLTFPNYGWDELEIRPDIAATIAAVQGTAFGAATCAGTGTVV